MPGQKDYSVDFCFLRKNVFPHFVRKNNFLPLETKISLLVILHLAYSFQTHRTYITSWGVFGVQRSEIKCRMQICTYCSMFDLPLSKWHKCGFSMDFYDLFACFGRFFKKTLLTVKSWAGNLYDYFLQLSSDCRMPMRSMGALE